MRLARSIWSTCAKIAEAAVGAPGPHTGRHAAVSPKALFNAPSNKQLTYRREAADGEQSLTATAAAAASCHKDEFWKEHTMKKLSARNQLKGKILEVKKGATTSHVRINIGNGIIITSAIKNEDVAEIGRESCRIRTYCEV